MSGSNHRESVEEILESYADDNASCDRLLSYHRDDGNCTVNAMLHALREDSRLVLYLWSEFSVVQIASGGEVDGEHRYAVYLYDQTADMLGKSPIEDWTIEPRRVPANILEERFPRVIHIDDSELVSERSPWRRTDDRVGRIENGPEPRP